MSKKIFNKLLLGTVLILLILASAIKIHSVLSFPKVSDWNYYQLQKIDKTKNEFSFVVFADNKNSITTFENLIRKVNKEDAMFAIDAGDLVYDGEKEKFRFFINQIEKLNKPLLTVIGNHDIKANGRVNYYELFGKFYYSFTVGKSYFIILDDANRKNLDPHQMGWLKNELQKSQKYKYRFVFMHVPLYDIDVLKGEHAEYHGLKDLTFANKLNDLFDKNNVTMLFVAHLHAYHRGTWGKTPYILTAGAGSRLAGSDPRHYFYHYIKTNVSDNRVKYEVIRLKSPGFELIDRLIHDAWIYIYTFFAIHFLDSIAILGLICLGSCRLLYKKDS